MKVEILRLQSLSDLAPESLGNLWAGGVGPYEVLEFVPECGSRSEETQETLRHTWKLSIGRSGVASLHPLCFGSLVIEHWESELRTNTRQILMPTMIFQSHDWGVKEFT